MRNFFILLLFAGGYTGWYFYHQKGQLTEGLDAAHQQYIQLEASVGGRRQEYQAAGKVVALKKRVADQKAQLAALRQKLAAVQKAQNDTVKERQATLAALRDKYKGQTMPMVLASGRDLGQVRIVTIGEAGLSVATTSGIVKVTPGELTPAMQAQFFFTN